jgi:tetratricopeptide (TPR) repeat protein
MKHSLTRFSLSTLLTASIGLNIIATGHTFPRFALIISASDSDPTKLYTQGDYQAAIRYWQSARPISVVTKTNLGCALAQDQQLSAAITTFQEALSLPANPAQQARIYYNLGNCHFLQENRAAAIEAYKQALKYYPGDQLAKYNLEIALRQPPPNPPSPPPPSASPPPPSLNGNPPPSNNSGNNNPVSAPPRMSAGEAEQLLDALQQHERGPQLASPAPSATSKPARDW